MRTREMYRAAHVEFLLDRPGQRENQSTFWTKMEQIDVLPTNTLKQNLLIPIHLFMGIFIWFILCFESIYWIFIW